MSKAEEILGVLREKQDKELHDVLSRLQSNEKLSLKQEINTIQMLQELDTYRKARDSYMEHLYRYDENDHIEMPDFSEYYRIEMEKRWNKAEASR